MSQNYEKRRGIMKCVVLRLTDEEFTLLERYRNGIPKQRYCKKKILSEPIDTPDFKNEQPMDDEKPDFYINVCFKLAEKEKDLLDQLKGDMTLQDFCRKSVLNQKIINLDELQQIKYHLAKMGGNINQIAKVANQIGIIDKGTINNFLDAFMNMENQVMMLEKTILKRLE